VRLNGRFASFKASYTSKAAFRYLFKEILLRESYRFDSRTEAPCILDCGANIGLATLYFKWLYPKARITAFEPDPATFAVLRHNVERNRLSDIVLHNIALWNEAEAVTLFVDEATPGALTMSTIHSRLPGRPLLVSGRKLSEFIDGTVDFLKLDVEGAEEIVLDDLLLSGKIALIHEGLIEYHHKISGHTSHLSRFLAKLEAAGLEYHVTTLDEQNDNRHGFQDIGIFFYRSK